MRKTFKYRIFPTHKQTTTLNKTLDGCRWLYNHFLNQRKTTYEAEGKSLSRYDQRNALKDLKKKHLFLNNIHSQILQDVSTRIDLAFRAFFRRIKSGDKPGFPRFKGFARYSKPCALRREHSHNNLFIIHPLTPLIASSIVGCL